MADILIAIPSARDWKPQFGVSLAGLIMRLTSKGLDDKPVMGLGLFSSQGASCLSKARQHAIRNAVNGGFSHILMLDDDMEFPDDVVETMFARGKPFVAANYPRKMHDDNRPTAYDINGNLLESSGKTGIDRVQCVGLGLCLIEVEPIKQLKDPLFSVVWNESQNEYFGEDVFFCAKCAESGIPIFVDHDVSNKIKHVGDRGYSFKGA